MPSEPKIRGKVNVVLNRLVSEGVIAGFRTNFDDHDMGDGLHMSVTVPEGKSLNQVRPLGIDALMDVAIGINVTVEPA